MRLLKKSVNQNNHHKTKTMKFIEYSIQWAKGEIFEGWCVTLFGISIIICTTALYKYGTTTNAKALVVPLAVVGLLFGLLGSYMLYSNNQRIPKMEVDYQGNATNFIESEKKRVEDFQVLYPISLAISAACFLITLLAFIFSKNATFQAIGIALSVVGFSLIIIDFFSKERAHIYYEHILNHL